MVCPIYSIDELDRVVYVTRISATLYEVTLTDFVTNEAHHRLLLRLTRTREIKMCADWFFMHFPLDAVSSVPNFALVNGRK